MSKNNDLISVRTVHLNNLIIGKCKTLGKQSLADAISREGLLDAIIVLYNECDKESLKKKDKHIQEFVTRYRSIIEETKSLRIHSNDFKDKGQIGRGYFGSIYLVQEKATGNYFAMKKMKKSAVTTSQVKAERDIMACRKSEWITQLQYAFQDPDNLYLIMEFLPGGDLLNLMIRHGPFDEEYTKFYLAEITQALNELHKIGYVHRDIKPENILVDRFGHIKLADFGNSASLDRDGHVLSMSPVGTPDYIAPELLQTISTDKLSRSLHGVTCDFWSMGIVGFEMLFKRTPFHKENVHDTYSKILSYCDDSSMREPLIFPSDKNISQECRNLLESLIAEPSKRFNYDKIVKHNFFENVNFDFLRKQIPPIIPSVGSEDDISNFEEFRTNTFLKKSITSNMKSNEFSGKDLPFLGYSFVHIDESEMEALTAREGDIRIERLLNKIKELQKNIHQTTIEITTLQTSLLKAEQKAQQMDSQSKILVDAKIELEKMKNLLKEKSIELATAKTEVKTLKSSLKIEEEMRLKNEKKITETLAATFKKWEKTKSASDQDYENKLTQKKNEISSINQKLEARENELATRVDECQHLQNKIESYKEMLKQIKDKAMTDKEQFEKNKNELIDSYEKKMIEIRQKLRLEKDSKCRLTMELTSVQSELRDSISSTTSDKEVNDRNVLELRARLNKEIERNNILRNENTSIENKCESLNEENEKLRQELQLIECTKKLETKNSDSALSSPYITAHGSLSDLQVIEEQLRSDLAIAKENEDEQRKRASELEKLVGKLEGMLSKFSEQPKSVGDMLEKQNEKLEDKLAAAREQIIVEKQSARTAYMTSYKTEKELEKIKKELEESQQDHNRTKRRMELTEEKIKKVQNEKEQVERNLLDAKKVVLQKEQQIEELKSEINSLKRDVQKEHKLWEKAEQERMKEKSDVIDKMSTVHKLEENIADLSQKLLQAQRKTETVNMENKRLQKQIKDELSKTSFSSDKAEELQTQLKSLSINYDRLKYACEITDSQLTEIEEMLENEQKQHKEKSDKLNKIYKILREKDDIILNLKNESMKLAEEKNVAEMKANNVQLEVDDVRQALEETQKKIINQQQQLIEQSNSLYEVQEKLELFANDSNSMQIMNENLFKEINILKEENTRILTDLYLSKEECLKTSTELKDAIQRIVDLKQENSHLNDTLNEKQNFYAQRDIKSQATLKQHQNLIDYLKLKVEDLTQKKKKTLADKIFGTHNSSAKKENVNPSSILYRTLEEELKREQKKNKVLQDKLDKFERLQYIEKLPIKRIPSKNSVSSAEEAKSPERETQSHRFELTLDAIQGTDLCVVCDKPITSGLAHWKCKECFSKVHRLCRSNLKDNKCIVEPIQELFTPLDDLDFEIAQEPSSDKEYKGDLVLKLEESFGINCVYEVNSKIILLGGSAGLTAFHMDTRNFVTIGGLENVSRICTHHEFSNSIIIANGGERLFQCDLRHLNSRSQSNACTKPKLDTLPLELPFANKGPNEKWEIVEIHYSAKTGACHAIAATTARVVILKFDWEKEYKFRLVKALNLRISSILCTELTAIVSGDKFYEIDLDGDRDSCRDNFTDSYRYEELTDTLTHIRNYEPMAAFKISEEELLLCFMEGGIFLDRYGSKSRPYEVNWQFTPTGFMFQAPLLYVSHYNHVQIIRIHRSYSNDLNTQSYLKEFEGGAAGDGEDVDEHRMKRVLLDFERPKLLTSREKLNVYLTSTNKQTDGQELYVLDGLTAFKQNTDYLSMETLSSEATCLTGSIDNFEN